MAPSVIRGSKSAAVGRAVRFFKAFNARLPGSRKTFAGQVAHPVAGSNAANTSALAQRTTQLTDTMYSLLAIRGRKPPPVSRWLRPTAKGAPRRAEGRQSYLPPAADMDSARRRTNRFRSASVPAPHE